MLSHRGMMSQIRWSSVRLLSLSRLVPSRHYLVVRTTQPFKSYHFPTRLCSIPQWRRKRRVTVSWKRVPTSCKYHCVVANSLLTSSSSKRNQKDSPLLCLPAEIRRFLDPVLSDIVYSVICSGTLVNNQSRLNRLIEWLESLQPKQAKLEGWLIGWKFGPGGRSWSGEVEKERDHIIW